ASHRNPACGGAPGSYTCAPAGPQATADARSREGIERSGLDVQRCTGPGGAGVRIPSPAAGRVVRDGGVVPGGGVAPGEGKKGAGRRLAVIPTLRSPVIPRFAPLSSRRFAPLSSRAFPCHPARSVGIYSPCAEAACYTLKVGKSKLTRRARRPQREAWRVEFQSPGCSP